MTFQVVVENEAVARGLSEPQARKALLERSEMLDQVFVEATSAMDPALVKSQEFKDGVELATFVQHVNDELTFIGKRVGEFDHLAMIAHENQTRLADLKSHTKDPSAFAPRGAGSEPAPVLKSLGQIFVESDAYKAAKAHQNGSFEVPDVEAKTFIERKAVFATGAGWAPEPIPLGRFVESAQGGLEITDVLPVFPTSAAAVTFMEETTFTNAAAERAENEVYAEAALQLTKQTATIRAIGVSLPVTDEQLEDVAGVRAYLDARLSFMVRQRLAGQTVAGNGVAPNLLGTLATPGIQTQAKAADPTPDAIYKAITLVRVTGLAQPNVVIAHPKDWQEIRLLRTVDGIYIWGSPADAGPERIWGLPVVVSIGETENTIIVGDYARFAGLYVRRGLTLETGYVGNDFVDGRITIRAGMRVAMVTFRPSAFCSVTGV